MIKINHINHVYNNQYILKNLSATFPNSGLVFIIGNNGVGKTTLLNLIAKEIALQEGNIIFDDLDINSIHNIRNSKLHYIPQGHCFIDDISVIDNLKMINESVEESKIIEVMKQTQLLGLSNQKAASLSGGQKARLSIARILLNEYKVVLIDEFSQGLDTQSKQSMMALLRDISKKTLIICVTHDTDIIDEDDIVFEIENGDLFKKKLNKNIPMNTKDSDNMYSNSLKKSKKNKYKLGLIISIIFISFLYAFVANIYFESRFVNKNKIFVDQTLYEIKNRDKSGYVNIDFIPLDNNQMVTFTYPNDREFQLTDIYLMPINKIKSNEIICGQYPESKNAIVIDQSFLSVYSEDKNKLNSFGILNYDDFLNEEVIINNELYVIQGVVNKGTHYIYLNEEKIYDKLANNYLGDFISEDLGYQIVSELDNNQVNQLYMHIISTDILDIGKIIQDPLNQNTYQITQIINSETTLVNKYYMSLDQVKHNYSITQYSQSYNILSKEQVNKLKLNNFEVSSIYNQKVSFIKEHGEISYKNIGILYGTFTSVLFIMMVFALIVLTNEAKYRKLIFLGIDKRKIVKIFLVDHKDIFISITIGYLSGLLGIGMLNTLSIIRYQLLTVRLLINILIMGYVLIVLSFIYFSYLLMITKKKLVNK